MNTVRIIPRLDIKGPNVVKGVHLEGLRVLGKPERYARKYYEDGADELLYQDVVASLYERNSLLEIIEKTSREIFIPLTVGGGLRTIDDIRTVLLAGADKVSLNTAVIRNPSLISEAANVFGSSTIMVAIEAMKMSDGSYMAFTDNGRERTGVGVFEWAVRAAELGAGEIMLTSIDREGTGKGFDLELTRKVAESISIPVIAHGGAGNVDHILEVIAKGKADAVSVASLFHYNAVKKNLFGDDSYSEGNIEFIKEERGFSKIKDGTLAELKQYLHVKGVECRYEDDGRKNA